MIHPRRRELRAALAARRRLLGTFVKLPSTDVIDLAKAAGFDLVVVDLEHSTLTESDAIGLVRHADLRGIPALVRLPDVDAPQICRLLENGAAGIQLSSLATGTQNQALVRATNFAPVGARSVSLANRVADHGATSLDDLLTAERADPPILVGQIESAVTEPWTDLLADLDVAFVGTTDLAVNLGLALGDRRLAGAVAVVREGAARTGIAFGGWSRTIADASAQGLSDAGYLVIGSDLQILGSALRATVSPDRSEP